MRLYGKYVAMHFKSQMQYKTSFFFTTFGQFGVSFATLLGISFMFARFESVGGFSYETVLICYAVMMAAFSTAELVGRGFDCFPRMLGDGSFDRVLVRPRNIIFQVLAHRMDFARLGRLINAVIVMAYALPRSGIDWTAPRIFTLCLMILCGMAVFFGLFVIYAAIAFFTVQGIEFMNMFTNGGLEHGRLPFGVYGDNVLKFLTFIVPLALIQYYPLLYLIGRTDNFLYALTPLVALLFLLPCYGLFRVGLRRYKSTGS